MDYIKLYYKTRKDSKGNLAIVLHVYKSRTETKKFSTGVSVETKYWDVKNSIVKKTHSNHIELNSMLSDFMQKRKDFVDEINRLYNGFDLIRFDQFDDGSKSRECFVAYMGNRLKKENPKNGGDKKASTVRKKKAHINNFRKFKSSVRFRDVTPSLLEDFNISYNSPIKKNKNTLQANHSTFRSYISKAIVDKLIKIEDNPYLIFKQTGEPVVPVYLKASQLKKIEDVVLTSSTLIKVRDFFLFSCYTGLAHGDYTDISFEDVIISDKGDYSVLRIRGKTDSLINLPVSKLFPGPNGKSKPEVILVKYMEIYEVSRTRSKEDRLFFKMSLEKMNQYLKDIAKECKIDVNLTTHVGRHTFGALLCNDLNVPITIVKELMAHSDINMTAKYVIANKDTVNTMLLKTEWKEIY